MPSNPRSCPVCFGEGRVLVWSINQAAVMVRCPEGTIHDAD